jgi:hypothetical protein
MNRLRVMSLALACALFFSAVSANAKPLDPATVHARILKRGIGNWICVEEGNGIALVGRIVSIDQDSVGLQLENYPEVTPVLYSDIVGLRMGLSEKGYWIIAGVGFAAVAAMAAVGIHEVDENRAKFPTTADPPAPPLVRFSW